jgi:hypothetical protein
VRGIEQWLCGSESRSVRSLRAVAVWSWIIVRAWYLSSVCVVVDRGPCVVLEQWLCIVDRGPCVVLEQWLYSSGLWSVRGTTAVAV